MIGSDGETTIERLRFAAEDGHPESLYLLGVAYARGEGVTRDDAEAAQLFNAAVRKGHARAKASLGFMIATGRGARRDPVRAYVLFREAEAQGDTLARELSRRMRKLLAPGEIKEAEKRLRV